MPHIMIIPCFRLPYFHVSNCGRIFVLSFVLCGALHYRTIRPNCCWWCQRLKSFEFAFRSWQNKHTCEIAVDLDLPIPTANTSWHCEFIVFNVYKRKQYLHDDVIKWKHFPCYWPFVWGIQRSAVNSPHKGHWRVNNREAGDLRR